MHIHVEPHESHAVLHLRGEFDTYYCPLLQEEIDQLVRGGMKHAVLNLRLVKFINSTALGAIIKANKVLAKEGGKLVISRPSPFCRDIIAKVGLDRVVPVFDTDEAAAAALQGAGAGSASKEAGPGEDPLAEDRSSLLFSPIDESRIDHFVPSSRQVNPVHGHAFGKKWSGVGRMSALNAEGLSFTWGGGNSNLDPFAMAQFLAIGTVWRLKFRLPLLQRGYCEAEATIEEVEERADGVKVGATFSDIDDETREAVRQYAKDLAYLKDELRKATDR